MTSSRRLTDPCCLIVRESGVGIHMWDATFEQYNPGLGIVSELEEIHTYLAFKSLGR